MGGINAGRLALELEVVAGNSGRKGPEEGDTDPPPLPVRSVGPYQGRALMHARGKKCRQRLSV